MCPALLLSPVPQEGGLPYVLLLGLLLKAIGRTPTNECKP